MIKIVAKLPVKAECVEAFKAGAAELVEKSAAEEGNIFYTLNASKDVPNLFAFIECWKDQDAVDSHNVSEHFTTILPKLVAMCDGDAAIDVFDQVEF